MSKTYQLTANMDSSQSRAVRHNFLLSHMNWQITYTMASRQIQLLDFSKTFDKVPHRKLMKMDNYSTLQVYQRSYSQVGHIPPKMSDKFESQHSKSNYLVGHRCSGRTREWIFKDFFYISRGEHVKHFVIDAYL